MVASALLAGVLALATRDAGESSSATGPSDATPTTPPSTRSTTTTVPATTTTTEPLPPTAGLRLEKIRTITATDETGPLSPKSIVASGTGGGFAPKKIYNHNVTAFDAHGEFLGTIPDTVELARFGITGFPAGTVQGGPVELAFSPDRTKAYTSNYSMYGPGFGHRGDDTCSPASGVDPSFVYRIDVASHTIDQVIQVGSVPKYVATTPDGRYVLVTNWCTYDLSVIDVATGREVQRLPMGEYPRGIAVSPDSRTAYVAIMGETEIKAVDLATFTVGTFADVGRGPRHIVTSPDGAFLYVTLNKEGRLAKVDARTGAVVGTVATGSAPRSMDISADGQSLYVVNYESSTVSKVTTADMAEVQELATGHHPIGVTYDRGTGRVWVACYGGEIEVFEFVIDLERYRQADHKIGRVGEVRRSGNEGTARFWGRIRGLPGPAGTYPFTVTDSRLVFGTPVAGAARWFLDHFEGSFDCKVTDDGTIVTHREAYRFKRPWRWLAEPLLRRWLERDTAAEMLRFKSLLDGDETTAR